MKLTDRAGYQNIYTRPGQGRPIQSQTSQPRSAVAAQRDNAGNQRQQDTQSNPRQRSGQTQQNAQTLQGSQSGLQQRPGQIQQNTQTLQGGPSDSGQRPGLTARDPREQNDARSAGRLPGQKEQNTQNIPEYLKPPSQRQKENASYGNQQINSLQRAFQRASAKKTYDSTSDLMAIANTESEASLQGICVRLSYKLRNLKLSNADAASIKSSTRKIKKVMGKARSKIRKLQKEAELEKKIERAKKAQKQRLQMEIRRELSLRRKVRKAKEKKDVADSYMESQMEHASQQTSGYVAPDAVFTDLGAATSSSIDVLSGDVALTDAAVAAVAEAGGAAVADVGGAGGTVDLAL